MKKVLVIGSLNMDMVVNVNTIPRKGETVLASSMEKYHGGKGANQAVASSKFGAKTYMIGAVGSDEHGKDLVESIKSNGVDAKGIEVRKSEKTGMAWITVDQKGENSIVVIAGSNGTLSKKNIDANEELFHEADIILLQLEIPMEAVEYAIKKGKENGCIVILNPAPAIELSPELLSKVDIITPNESELDILASCPEDWDPIQKAKIVLGYGVRNVICTLGDKGALLVNQKGHIYFPALIVNSVDTTGAGDCFNGVLAAELAKDESIEVAIQSAIKAASISVTKKGAQSSMPTRHDVDKYTNNK